MIGKLLMRRNPHARRRPPPLFHFEDAASRRSELTRLSLAYLADWKDYSGVPYRENAVERASRVSVCRRHLPLRKATNSRGRLPPWSGPPRPRDLSDETPNAAKTF